MWDGLKCGPNLMRDCLRTSLRKEQSKQSSCRLFFFFGESLKRFGHAYHRSKDWGSWMCFLANEGLWNFRLASQRSKGLGKKNWVHHGLNNG